jgi:anti-sigma B factor antagonist
MEMKISDFANEIAAVALQGRVDAFTVPALRERMDQLLSQGARTFVVDLSAVSFLDSAGIGVLVSLLRRARQVGGGVNLVWPTETAAQRILRLTKFDAIFDMSESADTALKKVGRVC